MRPPFRFFVVAPFQQQYSWEIHSVTLFNHGPVRLQWLQCFFVRVFFAHFDSLAKLIHALCYDLDDGTLCRIMHVTPTRHVCSTIFNTLLFWIFPCSSLTARAREHRMSAVHLKFFGGSGSSGGKRSKLERILSQQTMTDAETRM